MQSDQWLRIEKILQSVMERPASERAAALDDACGDDAELRREAESLLAFEGKDSLTRDSGFADAMRVIERQRGVLSEGRSVGAYRILREIGRGGMGSVYLAARADDAFQKLVALKVIQRGLFPDYIAQRFRQERQILAMLEHPNIARLLDGGATDDGQQYFVMEYIEGEPIDQYAKTQGLSVAERLKLFQGVCSAVSYAHQRLIIHRDIKPANVLVDKEGSPRLLDFGIAKLLSSEAGGETTLTGFGPLTPEYASPEQVRGEPITTATDVYSLGVLLYWLLTGSRPYRSEMSSPAQIERAICEEQPGRPSERTPEEVRRQLKGDLDTIVLTALHREPRRRYASVEQFSEDIQRHLMNLPVTARPDTRGYRAAKFIRRNRAWIAMAALTFVSLTGGIALSLWQTHAARTERDVARVEQAKSAQMTMFLQEMISGTWRTATQKGLDATVADILADASQRVDTELAAQPEVKAQMLLTIGDAYEQQAKYDLARTYLQKAYDLDVRLHGPEGRETASAMHGLASLSYLQGNYGAADSLFQRIVPIYRRHAGDSDFDISQMPPVLSDAAFAARAAGRFDDAERLWREALAYAPRLPARYRPMESTVKSFLAQLYLERGDIEKADQLASEAARELRALADRPSLAQALIDLGDVRRLERRYGEANQYIEEGTRLYEEAQGAGHPNVAYGWNSLATSQYYEGEYGAAEQSARKGLKIVETLPKKTRYRERVFTTLGLILNKTGRSAEGERLIREALAIAQQNSRQPLDRAEVMGALGECLTEEKRFQEAEPLLTESYQIFRSLEVPGSPAIREASERLTSLHNAREQSLKASAPSRAFHREP
jgi:serine/threonine-protein kinase